MKLTCPSSSTITSLKKLIVIIRDGPRSGALREHTLPSGKSRVVSPDTGRSRTTGLQFPFLLNDNKQRALAKEVYQRQESGLPKEAEHTGLL